MEIRVALVDDKDINRTAHQLKLANNDDISVVLNCSSGIEFLANLERNSENIDIVLMDIEMPHMDGIETIFKAKLIAPHIKFIIVTVFEDVDKIFNAIKAGAHGYLLKEDNSTDMVEAINNVYRYGAIPMSPSIARKAMQLMLQNNVAPHDQLLEDSFSLLSIREKDILQGLISGKTYKQIGESLFISPFTVRRHVANIYEKLHVNSRAQIIHLAHKSK